MEHACILIWCSAPCRETGVVDSIHRCDIVTTSAVLFGRDNIRAGGRRRRDCFSCPQKQQLLVKSEPCCMVLVLGLDWILFFAKLIMGLEQMQRTVKMLHIRIDCNARCGGWPCSSLPSSVYSKRRTRRPWWSVVSDEMHSARVCLQMTYFAYMEACLTKPVSRINACLHEVHAASCYSRTNGEAAFAVD